MAIKRIHRILGASLSLAIPVLYMVGAHINFEKTPRAKLRMILKHVGFWTGLAGTILVSHRFGFRAKTPMGALPIFAAAGALPILGYEVMRRFVNIYFPKPPKPSPTQELLQSLLAAQEKSAMMSPPAQTVSSLPAVVAPSAQTPAYPTYAYPQSSAYGSYYSYPSASAYNPYASSYASLWRGYSG
jgi:hypothetical protein